jgi:hypothetical protein
MKKKSLAVSFLSLALLAGCQTPASSSVSSLSVSSASEETSSSVESTEKLDTLSALAKLQSKDARFRLSVTEGEKDPVYSFFSGTYYCQSEQGYLLNDGGVSSFRYDETKEKLYRSEILKDSSGKEVTDLAAVSPSFRNLDLSALTLNADGSVDFTKKKTVTMALFDLFGMSKANYFYLTSLTGSLLKNSPDGLIFEADFTKDGSSLTYAGKISLYGKAGVTYLDAFEKNPEPAFTPTESEARIHDLFSGNNFTQYRDDDGDNTIDQHDYFTSQYYYLDFTDAYKAKDPTTVAAYGNRGYLAIDSKTMVYNYGGKDYSLFFLGCYLFLIQDGTLNLVTRPDPSNTNLAQSSFTQVYTDISYVMNYPSRMAAVNHFEYFTDNGDGSLQTAESDLLLEFINNFNLGDTITANSLTPDYLKISYDLKDADKDCAVTFRLYFTNQQYAEYVFRDFGATQVRIVDDYISANQLA